MKIVRVLHLVLAAVCLIGSVDGFRAVHDYSLTVLYLLMALTNIGFYWVRRGV